MFRSLSSSDAFPRDLSEKPVCLGIGNYDGFHRGHRAVFREARERAKDLGGSVGAFTFSPHPEAFFRGADGARQIYPRERKEELFAAAGLDFAVFEPFSKAFAEIPAEAFPDFLLKKIPSLRGIYVGDNFRFGARRIGDAAMLKKLARERGVDVVVVEPIVLGGARVSSTRIRAALAEGSLREANAMLGEPYQCAGTVISGNRLGRTIGFPTLNLAWSPELRPRFGAYLVRLRVPATGRAVRGIANYGVRPTVECGGAAEPLLETHLLDVPAGTPVPTYGDFVRVEWLDFLRPESRFDDLDALKTRLERDKAEAVASPAWAKQVDGEQ